MKKHELLEKAMHDYPKGTKFWWPYDAVKNKVTSSGVFEINNSKWIFDKNDRSKAVFNGDNWAEIIAEESPKSILDGKVAIQVNNEREFKLLMEHYESNGWKSEYIEISAYPYYIDYKNKFDSSENTLAFTSRGEKIIPFQDFAKEVGIEVPKFIMKSEDGVNLYEGDECYNVEIKNGIASLSKNLFKNLFPCLSSSYFITRPTEYKAFHSKENALKWIDEQNKPKEITVDLYFMKYIY